MTRATQIGLLLALFGALPGRTMFAQDPPLKLEAPSKVVVETSTVPLQWPPLSIGVIDDLTDDKPPWPGLKRLTPEYQVWLDPKEKQVVMVGTVVLRRGPLELFACLKNTKEHESIVSVHTKAYVVHAALLACGAETGNPARFLPEFMPARGTEIDVTVGWNDKDGKLQTMDARQWLRNVRTGEALKYPWVFGGSGFWRDPADGKQYYQAEEGDFICISNFTSAMLDLPVESPQANAELLFEAFTEHIPAEETKVLVVLKPKLDKKTEPKEKSATDEKKGAGAKPQAKPDGDGT